MFGHPNSRARVWRILFDARTKEWAWDCSLGELANMILAPMQTPLKLDSSAYLWATPNNLEGMPVKEEELSRCDTQNFADFFLSRAFKNKIKHFFKDIFSNIMNHMFKSASKLGLSLSRGHRKHLGFFRQKCPGKSIYDLSANPTSRCRTDLVDKSLPCLTTSSVLW